MTASDIMTSPVITVTPQTAVLDIAALLFEHRISAAPVLQAGRLVGIVSESDLLHRHEIGTDDPASQSGSWWRRLIGADPSVRNYIKSHARQACDVMTRDVITVAEDTPVAGIAVLLGAHGIKHVPVLRGEALVGIVSRADLVQALARRGRPGSPARLPGDNAIREALLAELRRHGWWHASSEVLVTEGVVHYWGTVDSEEQRDAARVAAENVPGVRAVADHRLSIRDIHWMV